jgi:hypothetical protein
MGGAITGVAATTTVGTEATTMARGIIGGDFHVKPKGERPQQLAASFSFNVANQEHRQFGRYRR